jgi:hypothetical protein
MTDTPAPAALSFNKYAVMQLYWRPQQHRRSACVALQSQLLLLCPGTAQ